MKQQFATKKNANDTHTARPQSLPLPDRCVGNSITLSAHGGAIVTPATSRSTSSSLSIHPSGMRQGTEVATQAARFIQ